MKIPEIKKAAKYIKFRFPLIGHSIRMAAVKKLVETNSAEAMPHLVGALTLPDKKVAEIAEESIRSLKNKEAIEVLCEGIINGVMDAAKKISIIENFQPKSIGRRCLFFVITGQVEKYLELDFEFQYLRAEYQAASEALQQRIRNAIQQSNDNRLVGLFVEVRKKLVAKDLTELEAELMLDVYARNHQMEEIFELLFFAPFPVMVKAIEKLAHANWQPYDNRGELIGNLFEICKTLGNKPQIPTEPKVALGSVFQKWMEPGHTEYISKSEEQLREIVKTGNPPEAVSALSALVAQNLLQPNDHDVILKHPHWLVRMAYIALGNLKPETFFSDNPVSVEGGEYWIKSMTPYILSKIFYQLKPVSLTPIQHMQLSSVIEKVTKDANNLKNWATLLVQLSGYILRNSTIVIGSYEKQFKDTDTAISI